MMQTNGRVVFKTLEPVRLKGKAQPMPLAAPLAEKEEKRHGGTIGKAGRDFEHQQLRTMVAELLVYSGGGTIMLLGGRGSGKNALAKALLGFGKAAHMQVFQSTLKS